MCTSIPSAVFHVSIDCDARTKAALEELARAAISKMSKESYAGPIEATFVIRDEDRRLAEYLGDTEAFDS